MREVVTKLHFTQFTLLIKHTYSIMSAELRLCSGSFWLIQDCSSCKVNITSISVKGDSRIDQQLKNTKLHHKCMSCSLSYVTKSTIGQVFSLPSKLFKELCPVTRLFSQAEDKQRQNESKSADFSRGDVWFEGQNLRCWRDFWHSSSTQDGSSAERLTRPPCSLPTRHTLKQMMQSCGFSRQLFFPSWQHSQNHVFWLFQAPLTQSAPPGWGYKLTEMQMDAQRCPGSRIISPVGHSLSTFRKVCGYSGKSWSIYLPLYPLNQTSSKRSVMVTFQKHKKRWKGFVTFFWIYFITFLFP